MTTRRVFLKLTVLGTAGACASCGAAGADGISGDVAAGNVKDLALDSLVAVDGEPVAVGRDAGGIYALSLICTHASCDMSVDGSVSASGVYCSCHGSRFDANGVVLRGPARTALAHYEVSKDASGSLTIHGASEVVASTRLAV